MNICDICPVDTPPRFLNNQEATGQVDVLFVVDCLVPEKGAKVYLNNFSLTKLTQVLEVIGHDPTKMAITSLVKCCPPDKRKPYKKELRACRGQLENDIWRLEPKKIITLGALAWRELGDGTTLTKSRLRVIPSPWGTSTISATIHPSAIAYEPTRMEMLAEDLDALLTPQGEETVRWKQTKLVPKSLLTAPEIVLDIETHGLPLGREISIVGYKLPHWNSVQVSPWTGNESTWEQILLNPHQTLLGHNIKFDLSRMAHALQLPTIQCQARDSMVTHFLTGEDNTSRSLERLSKIHTNLRDFKTETEMVWARGEKVEPRALAERNAYDVVATQQVYEKLSTSLVDSGHQSAGLDWMYQQLIPFISWLEQVGIGVDRKEIQKQATTQKRLATRCVNQMLALSPGTSTTSPKQLGELIYGTWGIPPQVLTPKGSPSTSKEALVALLGTTLPYSVRGYLKTLLALRGHNKTLTSYLNLDILRDTDIVYPEFFLVRGESLSETDVGGTVTGRLAVKRPAMQTISNGPLRKIFCSRWEKGELWCIDAAQMELKILAVLSGCRALLDVFNNRGDLHQWTADLCKVPRKTGKLINFASVYGCSPEALMAQAGLDYQTAHYATGVLQQTWAELYDYLLEVERTAIEKEEVVTPYGAVRRLPLASQGGAKGSHALRQATNFVAQRVGSDLVQLLGARLMWECDRKKYTPILSVHDEIILDVKHGGRADLAKVKRAVGGWRQYVTRGLGWEPDVEMEFELTRGHNWGEQEVVTTLYA